MPNHKSSTPMQKVAYYSATLFKKNYQVYQGVPFPTKNRRRRRRVKSMVDKAIKPSQVRKAIDALLTFIGKQNDASTNLLEEEDFIYLVRRMS